MFKNILGWGLCVSALLSAASIASAQPKNNFGPQQLIPTFITDAPIANYQPEKYTPVNDIPPFSVSDYSFGLFFNHVKDVPLDIVGVYGGTFALGFANWNWGDQSFRFQSEGWFGKKTGSGGVDKLGHAFTGAIIADYLTDRIRQSSSSPQGAAESAALLSLGVMTIVEVFDGFSSDHGFSYEDMIADSIGIGFSYLKNTIPGMREKIDFRQEYLPTKYTKGFHPFLGYEGKKFLLALKLSGFETFQDSPLRYVELHAGYYARGFNKKARTAGASKRRKPYVAIGINLSELLLKKRQPDEHFAKTWSRFGFEHFQVPYTYAGTNYIK